jgi:ADP-heptose:LPS heptosyltransferase
MKRILIWHQGALGDFLLSLPCIHAIRKHAEGTDIHLVSRPDISEIVLENRLVDAVSSNEKGLYAGLFVDIGLQRELGEFLKSFDSAFVFMRKPDRTFLKNLGTCIPECLYVRTVPPEGIRTHVSEFQMEQIRDVIVNADCPRPLLCPPVHPEIPVSGQNIISVHPGSGGGKKCWPLENFLALMSSLASEQIHFFVLLGPAEGQDIRVKIAEFISRNNISAGIITGRPISYIASRLKASSLYIGNDSGITHLAAAVGTPVVALFGPTDHQLWRPLGGSVKVLVSGHPCSPCSEEYYRNCADQLCLETLGVEYVLDKIKESRDAIGYNNLY